METVLVTGGAGFIGSNFIHHLNLHYPLCRVVNLDILNYAGSLENLRDLPSPERHTFIHADIGDAKAVRQVLQDHQIDTIVHFAAETHVDRSIHNPALFIQTNIVGTMNLLEAARAFWIDHKFSSNKKVLFHHISTDEVFGSLAPSDPPFSETTPYSPKSPYAASKAAADHLVNAYFHTYQLPVTISNCSNNYGPRQFPEKLIPLVIFSALSGKPIPVYGDGQQIRDWLFVTDYCDAICQIITRAISGSSYNIGGGNQLTNLQLIELICTALDDLFPTSPNVPHAQLIHFVKDRPGHDRHYAMDCRKIERELGWQPSHSIGDGLKTTIAWYLNHPSWCQTIQNNQQYQQWLNQNYTQRR